MTNLEQRIAHIMKLDSERTHGQWYSKHAGWMRDDLNDALIVKTGGRRLNHAYYGDLYQLELQKVWCVTDDGNGGRRLDEKELYENDAKFIAAAPSMVQVIRELQAREKKLILALQEVVDTYKHKDTPAFRMYDIAYDAIRESELTGGE